MMVKDFLRETGDTIICEECACKKNCATGRENINLGAPHIRKRGLPVIFIETMLTRRLQY
jgi:hypothetical protein